MGDFELLCASQKIDEKESAESLVIALSYHT
jgi:hypothetical protein